MACPCHRLQPIALLARLGVVQRHEGQGLGAGLLLLKDIRRTLGR